MPSVCSIRIEQTDGNLIQYQSEEEIYQHFDVNWIAPAMREDGSEFDKDLSNVITLNDINGDIHMHTTYSDGAFSIKDMIEANIKKGYEFMVITDHSQSLKIANGLSEERLLRQNEEIKHHSIYDSIFMNKSFLCCSHTVFHKF